MAINLFAVRLEIHRAPIIDFMTDGHGKNCNRALPTTMVIGGIPT